MLRLITKIESEYNDVPQVKYAIYQKADGFEMIKYMKKSIGSYSSDNGRTWNDFKATPDFDSGLSNNELTKHWRRSPKYLLRDPINDNILTVLNCANCDESCPSHSNNPELPKKQFLNYRVSTDGGRTYLFDKPIMQRGKIDPKHPIDDIYFGKNSFWIGDSGTRAIMTNRNTILVPFQMNVIDPNDDKKLYTPVPGVPWYWTKILIGRWKENNEITWDISKPIKGDPTLTSRGLFEPTLAQMKDGRILCVMRGSNEKITSKPSYRWYSVSNDDGHTWTEPAPWFYCVNQRPFYSPSSMSALFTHSSGRVFWIGHINKKNCNGSDPRFPLYVGEVDSASLGLHSSGPQGKRLKIDDNPSSDGLVTFQSFYVHEDRETYVYEDYETTHLVIHAIFGVCDSFKPNGNCGSWKCMKNIIYTIDIGKN